MAALDHAGCQHRLNRRGAGFAISKVEHDLPNHFRLLEPCVTTRLIGVHPIPMCTVKNWVLGRGGVGV